MKVSLLRKFSIVIAPLVASSIAFAGMDMDSRVTQLENQMQQVRTETAIGTYGAQTATTRMEVDEYGFFSTFDVLRWNTKVGGTEFAYTNNNPIYHFPVEGQTKDIDFKWKWGFRLGLGYNFDYDGWDILAQYTWFRADGSGSRCAGLDSVVIPLRGSSTIVAANIKDVAKPQDQFLFCSNAKSQYRFGYQSLDAGLGRAYYISGKLLSRPHWGLKGVWINQEQITRYTGGTKVVNFHTQRSSFNTIGDGFELSEETHGDNLGLGNNTVHVKDKCDFSGIGPRVGVDTKWSLGHGFSIFGNVAGALLLGHFDVDHKEKFSLIGDNCIELSANRHAFSPTVQFQLGLRYDKYIQNSKQHIGVGLGLEVNYWWRQNQMIKIDDAAVLKYERYSDDISMNGLMFDIRWDL